MNTLDRLAEQVSTVGGLGRLPYAPGTWGSLPALPLAWGLAPYGSALVWVTLGLLGLGTAAVARTERRWGTDDDQRVVVDELVGALIASVPAGGDPVLLGVAVVAFRVFDIHKPGPIRWVEQRVPGASGVMADDVAAGLAAAVVVAAVRMLI